MNLLFINPLRWPGIVLIWSTSYLNTITYTVILFDINCTFSIMTDKTLWMVPKLFIKRQEAVISNIGTVNKSGIIHIYEIKWKILTAVTLRILERLPKMDFEFILRSSSVIFVVFPGHAVTLFSFPRCHPHKSGGVQAVNFFTEQSIWVREVDNSLFRDVNSNSDRWHPDSQMFPLLTPASTTALTIWIKSDARALSFFQVFKIDVLVNGRLHSVEKRYSEFHALHKMVRPRRIPRFCYSSPFAVEEDFLH